MRLGLPGGDEGAFRQSGLSTAGQFHGPQLHVPRLRLGVFRYDGLRGGYDESGGAFYYKNFLHTNETATLEDYNNSACSSSSLTSREYVNHTSLVDHTCETNGYRWYSSIDDDASGSTETESSSFSSNGSTAGAYSPIDSSSSDSISTAVDSSGSSSGTVIGVIVGIIVVIAAIVAIIFFRRRNKEKYQDSQAGRTGSGTSSLEAVANGQRGLWDDDVMITAKRIPRDKLKVKKLLSRGAYGEVYSGVFNKQQVAIKMLIPLRAPVFNTLMRFSLKPK